jgi:hypothetical protein
MKTSTSTNGRAINCNRDGDGDGDGNINNNTLLYNVDNNNNTATEACAVATVLSPALFSVASDLNYSSKRSGKSRKITQANSRSKGGVEEEEERHRLAPRST